MTDLNAKLKTIVKAINNAEDFVFDGEEYTVTGYQITRDRGKLHLSIRLTDKTARNSWLWIAERIYFEERTKKR